MKILLTISKYCLVEAGSVVTRDVLDYALVYGSPARQHGWVCACGVKLNQELTCPECGRKYRQSWKGIEAINE